MAWLWKWGHCPHFRLVVGGGGGRGHVTLVPPCFCHLCYIQANICSLSAYHQRFMTLRKDLSSLLVVLICIKYIFNRST